MYLYKNSTIHENYMLSPMFFCRRFKNDRYSIVW